METHGWICDRALRNYYTWCVIGKSKKDKSNCDRKAFHNEASGVYGSLYHMNDLCIGFKKREEASESFEGIHLKVIAKSP